MDYHLYWSDDVVAKAESSKRMRLVLNPNYRGYSVAIDARDGATHKFTHLSEGVDVKDRGNHVAVIPVAYFFCLADSNGNPARNIEGSENFLKLTDAMRFNVLSVLKQESPRKTWSAAQPTLEA